MEPFFFWKTQTFVPTSSGFFLSSRVDSLSISGVRSLMWFSSVTYWRRGHINHLTESLCMSEMQIFEKAEFGKVRVVERDGQPWFVAKDVCECLELTDVSKTISLLDDDEKGTNSIRTPGGEQQMLVVSEPGLYSLILRSRKPEAKAFKRWVTHDVIPSIRKRGLYATPQTVEAMLADPDTAIKLLTSLKEERAKSAALAAKVEQDAPKVLFADSVAASRSSILIGNLAKLLVQNGVKIGQNRLFVYLREKGFLIQSGSRKNTPTQRSMEMGLFEVKEYLVHNPDGSTRTRFTTKVTGKGQLYFVKKFLSANTPVAA